MFRQLLNKSGAIIVFSTVITFMTVLLISIMLNTSGGNIAKQLSEDSKYVTISQIGYENRIIKYSDLYRELKKLNAKGAVVADMVQMSGFLLFQNENMKYSGDMADKLDLQSEVSYLLLDPVYVPLCMDINGKSHINIISLDYTVCGMNIYSGQTNIHFYGNIAGLKNSDKAFTSVALLIDGGEDTYLQVSNLKDALLKINPQLELKSVDSNTVFASEANIGIEALFLIGGVILIALLLIISTGVFVNRWILAKQSEIKSRLICGATQKQVLFFVLKNYLLLIGTGTVAGLIFCVIASKIPYITYNLGSINATVGVIPSLLLLCFGLCVAYIECAHTIDGSIVGIRRE